MGTLLLSAIALLVLLLPSAHAAPSKGPCTVTKQVDVAAKMRDGVTLLADVYRPTEAGSYPVILMRLPYDKRSSTSPSDSG
jgi:predicted acyl esterase